MLQQSNTTGQVLFDDVVERCLGAASNCVEMGHDRGAIEIMNQEFREVAREVAHWGLNGETKATLFLIPMEVELNLRHGDQLGRRLYREFISAFWLQTWSEERLDPERIVRRPNPRTDLFSYMQMDHASLSRIAARHYEGQFQPN